MAGQPHLGVLVSYLRTEEKLILANARARGLEVTPLFDKDLVLNFAAATREASGVTVDVVLDRCVAHARAGYAIRTFERWGIPTLNTSESVAICDDKALNSIALEEAGVPTPKTILAFSVEAAMEALEIVGYPAVMKPVTGSWGRLLAKVNGPEQEKAIIGPKLELGSVQHGVFYIQEFVPKPDRDIRAYVVGDKVLAASYRSSEHWVTNAARGATSQPCPITPEIEDLALRACAAVKARLAGVDLIETPSGLQIVEVNSGGEFRGLMSTTNVDIATEIVSEAIETAKRAGPKRGASAAASTR
ncbi:MAG: lysine biosynthesis protein LysX [Chloroflexota bacterium]